MIPHTSTTTKALTIYFSLLLPSKLLKSFFFMTRFTNTMILLNTSLFPILPFLSTLKDNFFFPLTTVGKLLSWWLPQILLYQYGLDLSQNLSHLKLQRFASHSCYTEGLCNIVGGLGLLLHVLSTLRSRLKKQLVPWTLQVALAKRKVGCGIEFTRFFTNKLHFLAQKCDMLLLLKFLRQIWLYGPI